MKLASVASNVVGKTGWLILNAIAKGGSEPQELAKLAQGSLKGKTEELAAALNGYMTPNVRWLLGQALQDLTHLDRQVNETDLRIRERMQPHADAIRRLCTIPGVQEITAWTLIAELGTDMSRFPDAAHVASWAGLCPGNCESAGKRQSGRTRKGDRYLRRTLIQNAWAVAHKKDCFLTAVFHRVASHRGLKRAAVAVARSVLEIAYCLLRDGGVYRELGGNYFDRMNPERTAHRLMERLASIGFEGEFHKVPAPEAPDTAPAGSKRGRPRRSTPPLVGTTRWTATAKRLKPPRPDAAPPELCPRCARWGIPCVHARNAKSAQHPEADAVKSDT